MKFFYKIFPAVFLITVFNLNSYGISAKPGIEYAAQPDGSVIRIHLEGDEYSRQAYNEKGELLCVDSAGFYVPAKSGISERETRKGPGLTSRTIPSTGNHKAVVILVEFPNRSFSIENPDDFYFRMLNEEDFSEEGATGSARDYFICNSSGLFVPDFEVFGPVMLKNDYSYYGKNNGWGDDMNAREMVLEACSILDDQIDFTRYDRNDDGIIDNVYIFYAGYGEADGGGANTIWPHSSDITKQTEEKYYFDGLLIDHYACSNELQFSSGRVDGIGTFCHEFSHVLGLPDLYSTMFYAFTPGDWDILSTGSYNNSSRTPPNYSSFERFALDWLLPQTLETGEKELREIGSFNEAFIVWTEKENEYFLFENRQKEGFDAYLPGHGMLVWHIDYNLKVWDNNIVNGFDNHQYVDLIEADNILNLSTLAGDAFPGASNVTEFSYTTKPALKSWAGNDLEFRLYDIAESHDGLIEFKVEKQGDTSGVNAIFGKNDLTVYDCGLPTLEKDLLIYDISGRFVADFRSDLSVLNPGVYILHDKNGSRKIRIR